MSFPDVIDMTYMGKHFNVDPFVIGYKSPVIKSLIILNSPNPISIPSNWPLEVFEHFLDFCDSGNTDFLTVENSPTYHSIAVAMNCQEFTKITQTFFEKLSPNEIVREFLLAESNKLNLQSYELECAKKLSSIISDPSLFQFPLNSLYSIIENGLSLPSSKPSHEQIGSFILSLLQKRGKLCLSFSQFVCFSELSLPLLEEYISTFETIGGGPIDNVKKILSLKKSVQSLTEQLQKFQQTNENYEKLQIEVQTEKKTSIARDNLLNLYQKSIPVIPDIPFSLTFVYNGVELAFTMINQQHYDSLGRQIAAEKYQPNLKNQQWIFRNKKNTIESVADPERLFDDNCDRSNYLSGTVLYCHPRNGFTNQQWDWVNNGLRSWRSQKFVSFIPDLPNNPFRLYNLGEKGIQQFNVKYVLLNEN